MEGELGRGNGALGGTTGDGISVRRCGLDCGLEETVQQSRVRQHKVLALVCTDSTNC